MTQKSISCANLTNNGDNKSISHQKFLYPLSRQVGENGENGEKNGENIILDAIIKNAYISQPKLAELTGFSQRKVNRIIAALREAGKIRRIGKTRGGHWEIIE
ncbi:MAG: winged helix-turn-helix domain-containing protein [Sodaliphilus sp.]